MISVIIPACDRPDGLRRAIASVVAQTRPPAEIIIVDNGRVPVEPPTAGGLPVRIVRAPVRCGAAQARNIGAAVADGPWLAFLDDDDTWSDDYLARVHRGFGARPEARLHLARLRLVAEDGTVLDEKIWDPSRRRDVLHRNPGLTGSNLVIHRGTYLAQGGFDVRLQCAEDRALLWACLRDGIPVAVDGGRTAFVHAHPGERLSDPAHLWRGNLAFLRLHRRDMGPIEIVRALLVAIRSRFPGTRRTPPEDH